MSRPSGKRAGGGVHPTAESRFESQMARSDGGGGGGGANSASMWFSKLIPTIPEGTRRKGYVENL